MGRTDRLEVEEEGFGRFLMAPWAIFGCLDVRCVCEVWNLCAARLCM